MLVGQQIMFKNLKKQVALKIANSRQQKFDKVDTKLKKSHADILSYLKELLKNVILFIDKIDGNN